FRGKYIAGNLLSHAVYWHEISPRGSTFEARHGGELLVANDTWFAPTDITLGPDGSVYVADWPDKRTTHPDPDAEWHRSDGRIYRIRGRGEGQRKDEGTALLEKLEGASLVSLLSHPNGWYAQRALRRLAERRDAKVVPRLTEELLKEKDPDLALKLLWAL